MQQENRMAGAPQPKPPRLSVEVFRGFLEGRPDEERWELIDGVAVMMAPPTLAHQRIATNLQRLLIEALERHDPTRTAFQRAGLNLAPAVEDYDPEADVVVIDSRLSRRPGLRYADRFYLAAEIVSDSDRIYVESKRAVYKLPEPCTCVLTVEQDRCEVRVDLRVGHAWKEQRLTKPDDTLVLPDFGMSCRVVELYRGTALDPVPEV
jgi:Uma2 family endonuclease